MAERVRRSFHEHIANGLSYLVEGWAHRGARRLGEFIDADADLDG